MSSSDQLAEPELTGITVEGYKAFREPATVSLGKLTLLLGRNNAGKSALCFAPLFATHAFDRDAKTPFPTSRQGVDFGPLHAACYRRQLTGLTTTVGLAGVPGIARIKLGATALPEKNYTQFVTVLDIEHEGGDHERHANIPWSQARDVVHRIAGLDAVARSIDVLRAPRPPRQRYHPHAGHVPDSVGAMGEHAPAILAAATEQELDRVSNWFECMDVRISVASAGDAFDARDEAFEIRAQGRAGEPVNLVDSGEGVAHILPLVVAVRLARRSPALLCIEQPELHLHPRAHVEVAELLLESLDRRPSTRLLVETHSDALVLRIRRAIAEKRLAPDDVTIYFVDDTEAGSRARPIVLDDRGTPDWWPEGVFAEPQQEYFAIRRALAARDQEP